MDLETVILSEVSQRSWNIIWHPDKWNLKRNDTNEFTYKTETDSQTWKMNLWLLDTLLYLKWAYCTALGALVCVIWQPGWEGVWGRMNAWTYLPLQETEEMRVWSRVKNIPWRRAWQPTAVFLTGESHGQRNLVGYSPWGCKSGTQLSD